MLKIRDLGINILPAIMPPPGMTYRRFMGYQDYPDMGGSETCPDMTCGAYPDMGGSETCPDMTCGVDYYRKPTKKAPSKKKPAKKPSKKPAKKPAKRPSKKGYRASSFGSAAIAQIGRQLEEQLRTVH